MKVDTRVHTERLGVAFVQQICSRAGHVWRELVVTDVGIDGHIEIVRDGMATGMLVAVQIKSGKSFVAEPGCRFWFIAKQDHYGYWARYSLPVIGILYDPDRDEAVWVNLKRLSTLDRVANGPYSKDIERTAETEFRANNLSEILNAAQLDCRIVSLDEVKNVIEPPPVLCLPLESGVEVSDSASRKAWCQLTDAFVSSIVSDEEFADLGNRLSRYYPAVDDSRKSYLRDTLVQVGDTFLLKTVRVADELLREALDPVAQHLVDLLFYVPNVTERLRTLVENARLAPVYVETANDIIEDLVEMATTFPSSEADS